jgi:hypothetical protein
VKLVALALPLLLLAGCHPGGGATPTPIAAPIVQPEPSLSPVPAQI